MLAIHQSSEGFSAKWIEYCKVNCIPYKVVNCYSNDILEQINGCNGLMWQWLHYDPKSKGGRAYNRLAREIIDLRREI